MRNFFDTLVESTTTKIKKSPMGEYFSSFIEDFKILKNRFESEDVVSDLKLGTIDTEAIKNLKDIFLKNVPQPEGVEVQSSEVVQEVVVEEPAEVTVVEVDTPRKVLKADLIQQAYDLGLDKKTNLKKMKKSDIQDLIDNSN